MQPLVSAIIPTYNRADLLTRAIRSVLKQTYTNLECIVVDDASTDNTAEIVQQFGDTRLLFLRHETNQHNAAAVNTGISRANGTLIAFLDDDDEWLPTKLERQLALIRDLPDNVGMVYCWMDYYDNQGHLVKEYHPTYRGYVFPHVLDAQRIGGSSSLLVRRAVIEKVGGFDESLRRGIIGDFIRQACLHYEVDLVPEVLVKVYVGHGYERLSRNDQYGLRAAIKGEKVKLTRFQEELDKYPKQTANIHTKIAHHYGRLGDWKNSLHFYRQAIATHPKSPKTYRSLLSSLRTLSVNWVRR